MLQFHSMFTFKLIVHAFLSYYSRIWRKQILYSAKSKPVFNAKHLWNVHNIFIPMYSLGVALLKSRIIYFWHVCLTHLAAHNKSFIISSTSASVSGHSLLMIKQCSWRAPVADSWERRRRCLWQVGVASRGVISGHAQSSGHCRDCPRLRASWLVASDAIPPCRKTQMAATFLFSRSPVPSREPQPLADHPSLSSTSSSCSGTTPWPEERAGGRGQ